MPSSERKYTHQNIDRAMGTLEKLAGYAMAIGNPFLERVKQVQEAGLEPREDYEMVVEGVTVILSACDDIKQALELMKEVV